MADPLDALRAQLAERRGPARTRPLIELAQALAERYWRLGPGRPAGLPYLNEAVSAAAEAYGYFAADDVWRGRVAAELGWLHAVRFLAHAGPVSDRDAAVPLLEESLTFPALPPVLRDMSRLALGQLYLSRVTSVFQSPDLPAMLIGGGLPPQAGADAERAVSIFRTMQTESVLSADMADVVNTMRTVAEATQGVLGSTSRGAAGFDVAGLMRAVSALQDLQRLQNSRPSAGTFPGLPSLFSGDDLARLDVLDRPVTVVNVPPEAPIPAMPSPDPIVPDPGDARRELAALVAPDGDLLGALAVLLGPDGYGVPVDTVDDMVALAVAVTTGTAFDGTDHLVLAVALYLRGRLDPGAMASAPGGDFELSGAALKRAAETLRTSRPAAVPVLNRLAALLGRVRTGDRDPAPPALFVVDPRRNPADAAVLREAFYPDATWLSAPTADAVLAGLGASLVHLACAVTPAGALRLADGTELPPTRIRLSAAGGGLAVLPPTGVGLPALGDALLAAGFRGVITWKRVVPSRVAALMLFTLHAALVDEHLEPGRAVAYVRDWMRDRHRTKPSRMPSDYTATFERHDLIDEAYWSALVFRTSIGYERSA